MKMAKMAKKKILVACGTAIATSTVVANKIKQLLTEKGVPVEVQQCKAAEAPSKAAAYDLIVTTTPIGNVGDTPVIRTVSFLSGVGMEKDIALILEKLGVE
jgi:galactitol PTS system EIIB component